MKNIVPLLIAACLSLLFCGKLQGQTDTKSRKSQPPMKDNVDQISSQAFDKMMVDFYNFALVGSQTPTTGFKVETNKPSIALKGNVFANKSRTFILNLELQGGVDDGLMQVFSASDLNPYFKTAVGFNFLGKGNSAWHYSLSATEQRLTEQAIANNADLLMQQVDTFAVIKTILDDNLFTTLSFSSLIDTIIKERKKSIYNMNGAMPSYYETNRSAEVTKYFDTLIEKVLIKYGGDTSLTGDRLLQDFKARVASNAVTTKGKLKAKAILNDYDKIKESLLKEDNTTLKDKQYDFEIELTKANWTWRTIRWLNITLNGATNSFRTYNEDMLFKNNSFSPGITISGNWLLKGKEPNQFLYGRFGVAAQEVTNTVEMDKFTYKKETVISISPTEQLKSTDEGVAYKGVYKEGSGIDLFAEGYAVPWRHEFVPGFYTKIMYRRSDVWLNNSKVPFDLGLVWNLTNSDKEAKNLFTLVPYVSWSNLRQEYKDAERLQKRKMADLFSVNVRFGIPVNIRK